MKDQKLVLSSGGYSPWLMCNFLAHRVATEKTISVSISIMHKINSGEHALEGNAIIHPLDNLKSQMLLTGLKTKRLS